MESEAKKIEDAITEIGKSDVFSTISRYHNELEVLINLAHSYLHAIQSGDVPREIHQDFSFLGGSEKDIAYARGEEDGLNKMRSLMLPLIVARDRKIHTYTQAAIVEAQRADGLQDKLSQATAELEIGRAHV